MRQPFIIGNIAILPGEKKLIELPVAALYTHTSMNIPVHIFHGFKKGPTIFVMAAIHGDEINGVETLRLLLKNYRLKKLAGTLIVIPIANVYGFIMRSRYLPDRRDLNRSFPGAKGGSLAARIAHLFMEQIISKCDYGIDLHTGNVHLENTPHLRTSLAVPGALKIAKAFNVPVIIDAKILPGSMRQVAAEHNIPILVYEGGEALRFNELAIQVALRGILNVLVKLKMIPKKISKRRKVQSYITKSSGWIRSPESGIVHSAKPLGSYIKKGDVLGVIADPFATKKSDILSPIEGILLGKNRLPLVNEGDALFHLAKLDAAEVIPSQFEMLEHDLTNDPLVFL